MDKFMNEDSRSKKLINVYNHLQDDESRMIYESRSLYSLTDDKLYMRNIVRNSALSKCLIECINVNKNKKLVLFGAGTWGKAITNYLDDIHWDYVIDNNKKGTQINGYSISSLDDLQDKSSCFYVIALLFQHESVKKQLIDNGVELSNILVLGEIAEQKQYFDLPYLKFDDNEVFVDAGGFSGETAEQFIKNTGNKYNSIYVFEPNKDLANKCRDRLKKYDKCNVIEKGCWSENTQIGFDCAGEGSSIVENSACTSVIETTSIDEILDGGEATYIKMDIEGAEYEALLGEKKTIKNYKPKLAISIYHKRCDIWEIPILLLSYNSDYKFYLRTYSFSGNDTVLYAL